MPKTAITLELGDDLRFRPAAPAAGTGGPPVARDRVLAALTVGRWRTATDIAMELGIAERTALNALTSLVAESGFPVERLGDGIRGNPFRYRRTRAETPADDPTAAPPPSTVAPLPIPFGDKARDASDWAARWRL